MPGTTSKASLDAVLVAALRRVARQLAEVGVTTEVLGPDGSALLRLTQGDEWCLRLCGSNGPCAAERRALVEAVWRTGEPQTRVGSAGCAYLATPVLQRRRRVAVALLCYSVSGYTGTEEFARLCDQLRLDRTYIASLLDGRVAHGAGEAHSLLTLARHLIAQALDGALLHEELATVGSNLDRSYEELSLLYRLSGAMTVSTAPRDFFASLTQELLEVIQISAAAVVYDGGPDGSERAILRAGTLPLDDARLVELVERHLAPALDADGNGLILNRLAASDEDYPGIEGLVAVPLGPAAQRRGWLLGLNKLRGDFDSVDQKLLQSVGNQATVFTANHHLYGELQELLMGVLHVLTASIDAKDQYTCGHSQRVALISRELAQLCGFDAARVRSVYLAGLLHDIGKIGVPETVLCKAGKLTDEEFDSIKRHPVIGAKILSNIRQMQDVIPGVMYHHERLDGRGYPEGLRGGQLPMDGLIVGLADCFDAMTSSRTYRRCLPLESVVAEIMRCSGTQFHPRLVDLLLSLDLPAFLRDIRENESAVAAIGGAILGGLGEEPPAERETAAAPKSALCPADTTV